jgi:hypothetical protein
MADAQQSTKSMLQFDADSVHHRQSRTTPAHDQMPAAIKREWHQKGVTGLGQFDTDSKAGV